MNARRRKLGSRHPTPIDPSSISSLNKRGCLTDRDSGWPWIGLTGRWELVREHGEVHHAAHGRWDSGVSIPGGGQKLHEKISSHGRSREAQLRNGRHELLRRLWRGGRRRPGSGLHPFCGVDLGIWKDGRCSEGQAAFSKCFYTTQARKLWKGWTDRCP